MPSPLKSPALMALFAFGAALAAQEGGRPDRPMPVPPGKLGSHETGSGDTSVGLGEFPTSSPGSRSHALNPNEARVVDPPALDRFKLLPDETHWKHRNLLREMQSLSRRGLIPVVPVPGDAATLQDVSSFPSGWKAYGFVVPAHGELEVKLDHVNQGWFRLLMVDKWGRAQEGMLQNMIPKGHPVVSFRNPKDTPQEIFVIADDPGWMSSKDKPYTLTIHRTWDARKGDVKPIPETVGIWARKGTASPSASGALAP